MPETTNYLKHANSNPLQRALINNFYHNLFELIRPLSVESVLDVGCGEGFTLNKLKEKGIGKKIVGVDYSQDAIEIGKKIYPNLNLKQGNVYELDFPEDSFELSLCTEVLEHLEDPKKAVQEIKRVTSKFILFSVPNEPFFIAANLLRGKYFKRLGNHPEHINHWTMWGIEKFLVNQGLSIVKSRHPFAWSMVLVKKP